MFVRIKAAVHEREKLEETMLVLCDLLNRGVVDTGFFIKKNYEVHHLRTCLLLDDYCELEEGKLKCLK